MKTRIFLMLILSGWVFKSCAQPATRSVRYSTEYLRANSDRIEKVQSSDKEEVYKLKVLPGDIISNGNRAEVHFKFNSEYRHTYNYSWDFKISGKYKQSSLPKYHVIIAQWLDRPAKGQTWKSMKGKAGPPFYFSVINRNEKLWLQVYYGLQGKNRKKHTEIPIEADNWYHVDATVFWSSGDDGYANVKINDSSYSYRGPNKYNNEPNLFKLGLYRNANNKDTTEAFIKNTHINEVVQPSR